MSASSNCDHSNFPMAVWNDGSHAPREKTAIAAKWFDHAVKLQADGHIRESLACYRQALEHSPDMAEACYNMGVIYFRQKAWAQSIAQFKKALDLKPNFVDAAFNLGAALQAGKEYRKAIAILRMTLDMAPGMAQAHYLQGMCHMALGAPRQAADAFRQAIGRDPADARHWFYMAEAHIALNEMDASLTCYLKAIALRPNWMAAHYNLAVALRAMDRIEDAIHRAKIATHIDPHYVKVYPLLFLLAQHACDWDLAETTSRRLDEIAAQELARGMQSTEPPLTNIRRRWDLRINSDVARSWSRHIALNTPPGPPGQAVYHIAEPSDRIRVGYLSSDYKDHAVAYQIRGLFEHHDRSKFEIFGYACNPDDGTAYRQRLARACDHFRDVHALDNRSIVRQIRADGIHILVDMAGHSKDNRLAVAAARPAPVQVSYLGFLGTTGADFMDYVLADSIVVPMEHAAYFTEKIVHLPHCYQANDDQMPISGQPQNRKQWGLAEQSFVYCSFNQPYKIDRNLFSVWMQILKRVEHGVLWLVERGESAGINLRRAAEQAGVDPARLIFTGFVPLDQNLARLQMADLVLDTLIYNGGATTANALWAGVPVLSVLGRHWVSRMSASALHAVGLPELIAKDSDQYRDMAVELALNPRKLDHFRQRLQTRRTLSPLFNTSQFTRHVESAYCHMWDRYGRGQAPASFRVEPQGGIIVNQPQS